MANSNKNTLAIVGAILGAALIIGSSSSSSAADCQNGSANSEKASVKTFTLTNDIKLEMVLVDPGSFTMSKKDGENDSSEVEHTKTLTKAFYIGKYEVTQAQYQAVMGKNPSWFKGDNRPVECVSWHEAMEFCEKMNKYAPEGWRFTLPTETQWEYAARGGKKSNGYKYSGSNDLASVGWYDGNSDPKTHEVGGKSANELGLYDMSGNVWEWCLDNDHLFNTSNNTKAEFMRAYRDNERSFRVLRGGSCDNDAQNCRSANRSSSYPGLRSSYLGFRLALVPAE